MTLEYENTEKPANDTEPEKVGYKHPPRKHQYPKGVSGNRKGRPKKSSNSLVEGMAARLDKMITIPGTKRTKISTLQLMIRHLVEQAIKEDVQAITEVVRLTQLGEGDQSPNAPYWYVTSYGGALAAKAPEEMTEAFFDEQDARVAEWKRELKAGGRSLRDMVEKELSRKTSATRKGKVVKSTMRDAVIIAMLRVTAEKPSLMKKLLAMIPEKKFKRDRGRIQILRPTADELKRNPAPGMTWDEWEEKQAANGASESEVNSPEA